MQRLGGGRRCKLKGTPQMCEYVEDPFPTALFWVLELDIRILLLNRTSSTISLTISSNLECSGKMLVHFFLFNLMGVVDVYVFQAEPIPVGNVLE